MTRRIAVVVSQGQSASPARRRLEEEIVAGLLERPGLDVTILPHLYDLQADSTGVLALQGIVGDMIVLAWLYPRAAFWTLDRQGIRGQLGATRLKGANEDAADEEEDADRDEAAGGAADGPRDEPPPVEHSRGAAGRRIYCLDLRARDDARSFLEEIDRLAEEARVQVTDLIGWVGGTPRREALQRYLTPSHHAPPTNGHGNGSPTRAEGNGGGNRSQEALGAGSPAQAQPAEAGPGDRRAIDEQAPVRRWYPVIDYSRCTNCMECIDFCLFGVYGIDRAETILVEQPDNCRKGCPACSRVCPENAILFPQHKAPAIAGGSVEQASLKIDLSRLFGAPDASADPFQVAARERDEQLLLAGRPAVGTAVGRPPRRERPVAQPADELDQLIDRLDELDI
jgi:hypothetical protein